jgi:collagenase-like PrtC family protease
MWRVVNAYRMALDELKKGAEQVPEEITQELEKISHRPYTSGFAFGDPELKVRRHKAQVMCKPRACGGCTPL